MALTATSDFLLVNIICVAVATTMEEKKILLVQHKQTASKFGKWFTTYF